MRPFEYLFHRALRFDYECPPICEALFSSTGEPVIVLEAYSRLKVQGVELQWDGENFHIIPSAHPGALCFSVYRADSETGPWVIVAECVEEVTVPDDGSCYIVTEITAEGESDPSDPICPTLAECPTWISPLSGDDTIACGGTISFTCEAAGPNPGDLVDYQWTKDDEIIFEETKTGASTLVVTESATTADSGNYVVSATVNGCEITDTIAVVVSGCEPGPCGIDDDLSDPPSHFFIKLDTPEDERILGTVTIPVPTDATGAQELNVTIPVDGRGVYLLRYKGGGCGYSCDFSRNLGDPSKTYYLYPGTLTILRYNVGLASWEEETADWIFDAWSGDIQDPGDVWGFCGYGGDVHILGTFASEGAIEAMYRPGGDTPTEIDTNLVFSYEQGGLGTSVGPNSELQVGTQIRVAFCHDGGCGGDCSDGPAFGLVCDPEGCCGATDGPGPTDCTQNDAGTCSENGAYPVPSPHTNCGTCHAGSGPTFDFIRYGYWIEEPLYVRIRDMAAAFTDQLSLCEACNDAGEFDTLFAGEFYRAWYKDDSLVYLSRNLFADDKLLDKKLDELSNKNSNTKVYWFNGLWYIDIYCKSGGGNQLWWRGIKAVGQTPVGVYNRDTEEPTMCSVTPACIFIEEFNPFA